MKEIIETKQQEFHKSSFLIDLILQHYESFYGTAGSKQTWDKGPIQKLHPAFFVLEIEPSTKHQMWTYATVGMSLDRDDDNLIELITYSKEKDPSRVELLTVSASYHRNVEPLNLHHTVVVGQLTDSNTTCDHGFISLPYLDGEELQILKLNGQEIHCYWYIPITEKERDFKIKFGCDALEDLFEEKRFDYLDKTRKSLV